MEAAVTHGYLAARVEGYGDKRARRRARKYQEPTGAPNLSGWQQLTGWVEQHAPDRLVRSGERLVH